MYRSYSCFDRLGNGELQLRISFIFNKTNLEPSKSRSTHQEILEVTKQPFRSASTWSRFLYNTAEISQPKETDPKNSRLCKLMFQSYMLQ